MRRYVTSLVGGLLALGEDLEIVALGGPTVGLPAGVSRVPEPWHPPTNMGWALAGLPRAARMARVDLVHAPAYTAPFFPPVPVVLTIHDVSYARHPEWYPYRRDWLRRWFYRRSARVAARIITDSRFSAGEIEAAYGVPRDTIAVVPLAPDAVFTPHAPYAPDTLPAGVRAPYVLHVGDLHPRRNLEVALGAVLRLRRGDIARADTWANTRVDARAEDHNEDGPAAGGPRSGADAGARGDARRATGHERPAVRVTLVLAGVDRASGTELAAQAEAAGDPDALVRLGRVSERDLAALYRGARALVYPSRYEGFGLPLVEAMASGTPVIAADAASLPEVVGTAGRLLDPDDADGWTAALAEVLADDGLAGRMRQAGLVRAAGFTWQETARRTLDVYRAVVP
ncbi:MAG: glycosyltransferase family 4 protein [Vicinamibacterales bacterium]